MKEKYCNFKRCFWLILMTFINTNIVFATTYTSSTNPTVISTLPNNNLTFTKATSVKITYENCTQWDGASPSNESIILNENVRNQQSQYSSRIFYHNLQSSTKITKTYTHGARYKGNLINMRLTYYDFQPFTEDEIQNSAISIATPSFGFFNESFLHPNTNQYSQLTYSFKVKYEFFDDNNSPVKISNGYVLIGGHNTNEWTANIENISKVYVTNNTIMTNTITKNGSDDIYNKGVKKYNTWLIANKNWDEVLPYGGYVLYEITNNSSNFTLAMGKDFVAGTVETNPSSPYYLLTIKYLDKDTNNAIATQYGPEGIANKISYNVTSPAIKDYYLYDSKQSVVSGIMHDKDTVIEVYYSKKPSLTINYLDESTKKIALRERYGPVIYDVGQNYSIASPETIIKDNVRYQLSDNNQKVVTGVMKKENVVINVLYKVVDSPNDNVIENPKTGVNNFVLTTILLSLCSIIISVIFLKKNI